MLIPDGGIPPNAVLLGDVDAFAKHLKSLGDDVAFTAAVVLAKLLLQVLSSFLSVVVGHLGEEMMRNVGILNVVEDAEI